MEIIETPANKALLNRKYKDSLFGSVFHEEEYAKSLGIALLKFSKLDFNDGSIDFLTLKATSERKNDLSFVMGDKYLFVIEFQSTRYSQMTVRMGIYSFRLLEEFCSRKNYDLHRGKKFQLPNSLLYVISYDLSTKYISKKVSFREFFNHLEGEGHDFIVNFINVCPGYNEELKQLCTPLGDCVKLIQKVGEFQADRADDEENTIRHSIYLAIEYCIAHDILKDFLTRRKEEVVEMFLADITYGDLLNAAKEDALEEGIQLGKELGKKEGLIEVAKKMYDKGTSLEQISIFTDLSIDWLKKHFRADIC